MKRNFLAIRKKYTIFAPYEVTEERQYKKP